MGSEKDFCIVEYFESEEDFRSDPCGYGVSYKNEIIKKFGDNYHDDGRAKSEVFILGMCYANGIDIDYYQIGYKNELESQVRNKQKVYDFVKGRKRIGQKVREKAKSGSDSVKNLLFLQKKVKKQVILCERGFKRVEQLNENGSKGS